MLLCLKCAREEYDDSKDYCRVCGTSGTLWRPQNVGGINGNEDAELAKKLIQEKKKPWQTP